MNVWIFNFYRLYISIAAGGIFYFYIYKHWWVWVVTSLMTRVLWYVIERRLESIRIEKSFRQHSYEFKQQFGPYGIRIINKAENDFSVKQSLAEVFTPDMKKLKAVVEQLELMDTLFKAGMQPDGDTYQIHDLKLRYGKTRLENDKISSQKSGARIQNKI
jgi:hypothetical protein